MASVSRVLETGASVSRRQPAAEAAGGGGASKGRFMIRAEARRRGASVTSCAVAKRIASPSTGPASRKVPRGIACAAPRPGPGAKATIDIAGTGASALGCRISKSAPVSSGNSSSIFSRSRAVE